MNIDKRVAARIRELLREQEKTMEKLAFEADVSKGHLSILLRGKKSATARTLSKLADALGVQVKDLFDF